jgi:hypothetical protein
MVKNLSRLGLAISHLPHDLDRTSDLYSVILEAPDTLFKLLVKPVWEIDDGVSKTIGIKIENSSWTWTDFVMRQETLMNQPCVESTAH